MLGRPGLSEAARALLASQRSYGFSFQCSPRIALRECLARTMEGWTRSWCMRNGWTLVGPAAERADRVYIYSRAVDSEACSESGQGWVGALCNGMRRRDKYAALNTKSVNTRMKGR